MNITLIGGHGKVALLTHPLLVAAGHDVRAVIRNPEHAKDVQAAGAEPVLQDIETLDADGWDALLQGSDLVVWSAGAGGGNPERTAAVDHRAAIASMDAAQRCGVRRYIMVSYFGTGPDHGIDPADGFYAYAEAKAAADAHLRESLLDWVILMPSALTLEDPTGRIDTRADQAGQISRGNVARMIAAAVEQEHLSHVEVRANDGDEDITEVFAALAD